MLLVFVVAMVVVGAMLALQGSSGPTSPGNALSLSIADIDARAITPVKVVLPGPDAQKARVFFVRQGDRVDAFLGVSTHLGCSLVTRGDPTFGQGFARTPDMAPFEDPCGGSAYALNGDCVSGPCPRALDRYTVQVSDGTARIDLDRLAPGTPRSTSKGR